jgi:hypothetical protein
MQRGSKLGVCGDMWRHTGSRVVHDKVQGSSIGAADACVVPMVLGHGGLDRRVHVPALGHGVHVARGACR